MQGRSENIKHGTVHKDPSNKIDFIESQIMLARMRAEIKQNNVCAGVCAHESLCVPPLAFYMQGCAPPCSS